jgi:hypothetical protein
MTNDVHEFGYRQDRVRRHTSPDINRRIDEQMQAKVRALTGHDPKAIDKRIRALEREWDIERVLEMNASLLAFGGVILGTAVHRRWLLVPAIVLPFLFQHALQGWCPPVPLLRRLGVRTQREIEAEKYALNALQKKQTASGRKTGRAPATVRRSQR